MKFNEEEYKTFQFWFDEVWQDDDTLVALLEAKIKDSVYDATSWEYEKGVYLSGGLDSSIIALLASRFCNLIAFHGHYKEEGYSEEEYAEAVASRCGINLVKVLIEPSDVVENLANIIRILGYPMMGPGVIGQYVVARKASKHVKVVLSGEGGDELFGGYSRYYHCKTVQQYYDSLRRDGKVAGKKCYHKFLYKFFQETENKSFLEKMMDFDLRYSLPFLLYIDKKVNKHFGLYTEAPFMSPSVVHYARRLRAERRTKGGPKGLLKEMFGTYLPEEVLNRKDKMGFPIPFVEWAKTDLRDWVKDILGSGVEKVIDAETKYGRKLWGMLCLELWRNI